MCSTTQLPPREGDTSGLWWQRRVELRSAAVGFFRWDNPKDRMMRPSKWRFLPPTMGHFRGRIKVWDVVNEALAPDGSLAENVFYRKMGPGYIEECFRWAHEADPDAMLLYNDNKVEGMNGPNKAKADAFYTLLAGLVRRGVPIHGCGCQAHFNAAGVGGPSSGNFVVSSADAPNGNFAPGTPRFGSG